MPFVTKCIYYMNCFYNKKYNDYVWIYFKERETTYYQIQKLIKGSIFSLGLRFLYTFIQIIFSFQKVMKKQKWWACIIYTWH